MLAEPSSSRISYIPYVAEPEGLSPRPYGQQSLNPSVSSNQLHERAYLQPATPHGFPGLSSPDDFVSPLLDSVLLDVPGPPTIIDGSSSGAGQGDLAEEGSPKRTASKGKRKVSNVMEEERPLRRFKKKTEIACDFCRGKWPRTKFTGSHTDIVTACGWSILDFRLVDVSTFSSGRKLGCSGDRPKCKACIKRKGECNYAPAPRRRGPGKAPRGSRRLAKGQQPFLNEDITFRVPFPPPPIQSPAVDNFGPPPANVEEIRVRERHASSVDRIFLTFPWTGNVT